MTRREAASARPSADVRGLRADARRNRARVLGAADEAFAAGGLAAPTGEIARRAGVGVGTVFRHFPTKQDLVEAVVAHRLRRVVDDARALAGSADPGAAFFGLFTRIVEHAMRHKALFDSLAGDISTPPGVHELKRELGDALATLLARAKAAGAVRVDIEVPDVMALVSGCLAMEDQARGERPGRMTVLAADMLRARG